MERLDRRDCRFIAALPARDRGGRRRHGVALPARVSRGLDRVPRSTAREARVVAEKLLDERGPRRRGRAVRGRVRRRRDAEGLSRARARARARRALYGREAKIWHWGMRWFRSGVKEEERVTISPLGDLIGFRVRAEGGRAGRAPVARRRRARSPCGSWPRAACPQAALKADRGDAGLAAQPHRLDVRRREGRRPVRRRDGPLRDDRGRATASRGSREFVHVPEAWTRDYETLRSKNEAAGQVATFALFVTLLAMLAVLVAQDRPQGRALEARRRRSASSRSCSRCSPCSTTCR